MEYKSGKPGHCRKDDQPGRLAVLLRASFRARVFTLAVWVVFLGTTTVTSAFEGYEHRQIGDAAFFVAMSYVTSKTYSRENPSFDIEQLKDISDICTLLAPDYRNGIMACKDVLYPTTLTYGEFAACIDHFKGGPERLISHVTNTVPREGRAKLLASAIGNDCRRSWTARSSARANDAHFQGDALSAFKLAHLAALQMVHETDDKYLAAVVNAGADHYLLDLLAPGHVYVRRADVTDASALSAHDLANRKGGNFHIANDPDNRANSGFHELRVFVCNEIRDELVRSENIRFRNRNIEKWNMKGVFASNEEIGAACTRLEKQGDVKFRGDDFLFEADEDAWAQRLYAVLVQAQSIFDVLKAQTESSTLGQEANSFSGIRVETDCASQQCPADRLVLTFDGVSGYLPAQHNWGLLDVVTLNLDALMAEDDTYRAGSRSVMLGLSVEGAAIVSDSGLGRGSQILELWVPVANGPNSWFIAGYATQWEPSHLQSLNAHGFELRYALGNEVLPGFTFAPFYRNVLYDSQVQPSFVGRLRLQRAGLRIDVGATDLLGAYFTVYNDSTYRYVMGQKISDDGLGVSFGLTIRGPASRIWRCLETLPRCIASSFSN